MSYTYKPITHKWDILPDIEENFLRIQGEIGNAGSAKFVGWPVDAHGNYVYPNTSGSGGKPYVLPVATDKSLGGVVIGAGVISDATGNISVTPASIGALTKADADKLYAPANIQVGISQATADSLYSPLGALTKTSADILYETSAGAQAKADAAKAAAIAAASNDATNKSAQVLIDAKAYVDTKVSSGGGSNTGSGTTVVNGLDKATADTLYAPLLGSLTKADADTNYAPAYLKTETVKITGDQEIEGKKVFKTLPVVQIGSDPETNLATEAYVASHAVSGGTPYTLPVADDSHLGGVMIGNGIDVDPATGKISVDTSGITATVAPATTTTLGGIIVGDNLTIDSTGKLSATVSNSTGTVVTTPADPGAALQPNISIHNDRGNPNWFRVGHFLNARTGSGWDVEITGAPGWDYDWNITNVPTTHNTGMSGTRTVIGMHKGRPSKIDVNYYHLGSKPIVIDAKIERTLTAASLPTPLDGVASNSILNTLYIRVPAYTSSVGVFVRQLSDIKSVKDVKFVPDGSLITQADLDAITTLETIPQRMAIGTTQAGVSANGVDNNLYLTAGTGGEVVINNRVLSGLAAPTDNTDAATKKYVDDKVSSIPSSGGGGGGSSFRTFDSWDKMKATSPTGNGEVAFLKSYHPSNDSSNGCGWFRAITGVSGGQFVDDGGVTCRGSDYAWIRQYSDEDTLTIYDFGAWGDGKNAYSTNSYKSGSINDLDIGNKVHDDGPAMKAMWKFMKDNDREAIGIRIPAGTFGITSIDFTSEPMKYFNISGPYQEYGDMPATVLVALTPDTTDPMFKVITTTTNIQGLEIDGRCGVLKDATKGRKGGVYSSWDLNNSTNGQLKVDHWPDPNENGGKPKIKAYMKDFLDPNKGGKTLYGKQPLFDIRHRGSAGYMNVKCLQINNVGGHGLTWVDAIDSKIDQMYSNVTFARVVNATWSCYQAGAWDHTTAIELTNCNFETGYLQPMLYMPRAAQSMMKNIWLQNSEYGGNLTNGHWMIDSFNYETNLNTIDARSSRIILRHLDGNINVYRYDNPASHDQNENFGGVASNVFKFGVLTGKNPTEKVNPNTRITYLDGTPVPSDRIDVITVGTPAQCKAYNDAPDDEKDKHLVTNHQNWNVDYQWLSTYENGFTHVESYAFHNTGSMKYGFLAGHRCPPNPDPTQDYIVNLLSFDNAGSPDSTSTIEIDVFTQMPNANNGGQTWTNPTTSGQPGICKIKIHRPKSGNATTSWYCEGQSAVKEVYGNNWGGNIYIKLAAGCSSAVAFARSTGQVHANSGAWFLCNWKLKVVNATADSVGSKVSRLDFNNGYGKAGIGLVDTHVSMATPQKTGAPAGTPAGTIEVIVNGSTVKIPYYT